MDHGASCPICANMFADCEGLEDIVAVLKARRKLEKEASGDVSGKKLNSIMEMLRTLLSKIGGVIGYWHN